MSNQNKQRGGWQKKQTAINSQNDRFTIYAHMDTSKLGTSGTSRHVYRQKQQYKDRQEYSQYQKSIQTPMNHLNISKMKQTLKHLQSNLITNLNSSNEFQFSHSIQNSRKNNDDFIQENEEHRASNPRQRLRYKEQQFENRESETDRKGNTKRQKLYMDTDKINERMSYNQKLQIMKIRLQQISNKQYPPASNSTFNYKKTSYGLDLSSPPMSQQSTKRNRSTTIINPQTNHYFKQTKNPSKANKNANTMKNNNIRPKSKSIKEQYSNPYNTIDQIYNVDMELEKQKNTVPMPNIIHEDQQQIEENKRSSTLQLQLNPKSLSTSLPVNTQHKRNSSQRSQNYQQQQQQKSNQNTHTEINKLFRSNYDQPNKSIPHPNAIKNINNSKIYSNKKQIDGKQKQLQYYDLYPHYSEELDMKIYKNNDNYNYNYEPNYEYNYNYNNNTNKSNNTNKDESHNKSMGQSMLIKSKNKSYSGNQSSQSTKRRDSLNNIQIPSTKKNTSNYRYFEDNRTNSGVKSNALSKNKSKSKINVSNNLNTSKSISNKNKVIDNQSSLSLKSTSLIHTKQSKLNAISMHNNFNMNSNNSYSYSYNLINKNNIGNSSYSKDSRQDREILSKSKNRSKRISNSSNTNTLNQSITNLNRMNYPINSGSNKISTNNTVKYIPLSNYKEQAYQVHKVHRASITDLIIDVYHSIPHRNNVNSILDNNLVQIFSASLDYTLKYMVYNLTTGEIVRKQDIYKHRGGIQAFMKVDDMVFTVGRDMYLKYAAISIRQSEAHIINENMYKLSSSPIQLSCIQQNIILIGCKSQIIIFDIQNNSIIKAIPISDSSYQVLQNGRNIYIGTKNSLSLLNHRLDDNIIELVNGLRGVRKWIMHPNNQIYLYENEDGWLTWLDMSKNKLGKEVGERNNKNRVQIGQSRRIVDYCWVDREESNLLALLMEQQVQTPEGKGIKNSLLECSIKLNTNHISSTSSFILKQVSINFDNNNSPHLISTLSKSLTILKSYKNTYLIGDKSGNIHIIANYQPLNDNNLNNTGKFIANSNIDSSNKNMGPQKYHYNIKF